MRELVVYSWVCVGVVGCMCVCVCCVGWVAWCVCVCLRVRVRAGLRASVLVRACVGFAGSSVRWALGACGVCVCVCVPGLLFDCFAG